MTFNEKIFLDTLAQLTDKRKFVIAYSGGLDSQVLLYAMAYCRSSLDLQLRAIHIHHGLSPNANFWLEHCKNSCQELAIPISFERIQIEKSSSKSLEALARAERYHVLAKMLADDEVLLTAHHQDDQAETLLLQLFRGSGTKGLAAMPMHSPFAKGTLLRPLLNFSRQSLLNFALANNLHWIEDESNTNISFNRNYIRHELMPIIRKRWPSISNTLSRTAKHCVETNELLHRILPQAFKAEITERLSIDYLKKFDAAQQRNILRFWIQQNNFCLPNTTKLHELQRSMLTARIDARPYITWGETEVRRHRGELYIMKKKLPAEIELVIPWQLEEDLIMPHNLGVVPVDFLTTNLPAEKLHSITVRFRQGGERCKINGRHGTHKLKKLFQEWSVPTWQRDRVPLIYMHDKLIAVYPYCICPI